MIQKITKTVGWKTKIKKPDNRSSIREQYIAPPLIWHVEPPDCGRRVCSPTCRPQPSGGRMQKADRFSQSCQGTEGPCSRHTTQIKGLRKTGGSSRLSRPFMRDRDLAKDANLSRGGVEGRHDQRQPCGPLQRIIDEPKGLDSWVNLGNLRSGASVIHSGHFLGNSLG